MARMLAAALAPQGVGISLALMTRNPLSYLQFTDLHQVPKYLGLSLVPQSTTSRGTVPHNDSSQPCTPPTSSTAEPTQRHCSNRPRRPQWSAPHVILACSTTPLIHATATAAKAFAQASPSAATCNCQHSAKTQSSVPGRTNVTLLLVWKSGTDTA